MSNHQNDSGPQSAAAKGSLSVVLSTQANEPKGSHSSLTIEKENHRKGPRPKQQTYPMSAPVSAIRKPKTEIIETEMLVWLDTKATAKYLGCSPGAIRMKRRRSHVIGYKPFGGRKWYFKRSDLDRAIESSKIGGRNGNN